LSAPSDISFSASDAALEGFQVLRRHWRVVVGWAVFNLLALLALVIIVVIVGVGVGLAAGLDKASSAAGVIGAVVGGLATGVIETVLIVAIYRLMLRPDEESFLHLRLGRAELRVFLVALAFLLGVTAFGSAAYGLVSLLGQVGWPGKVVGGLATVILGGFLMLRLGLTAPMSFAEGKIDFAASWRITRGRALPLLGMWVLNSCLFMLVWVALYLAVFVTSGLLTGFHGFGPAEGGEALQAHPARYLIEGVVPILAMPALLVVSQAPWVAAYQAFTRDAVGGSEPRGTGPWARVA
jgi:hypothetical protein